MYSHLASLGALSCNQAHQMDSIILFPSLFRFLIHSAAQYKHIFQNLNQANEYSDAKKNIFTHAYTTISNLLTHTPTPTH